MTLNGKRSDGKQVFDMVKVKWPDLNNYILDCCNQSSMAVVLMQAKQSKYPMKWTALPTGTLKFNVDEALKEKLGRAGIG